MTNVKRWKIIEQLKKNKIPFGLLSKAEQEVLTTIGDVLIYGYKGEWVDANRKHSLYSASLAHRIKPEYREVENWTDNFGNEYVIGLYEAVLPFYRPGMPYNTTVEKAFKYLKNKYNTNETFRERRNTECLLSDHKELHEGNIIFVQVEKAEKPAYETITADNGAVYGIGPREAFRDVYVEGLTRWSCGNNKYELVESAKEGNPLNCLRNLLNHYDYDYFRVEISPPTKTKVTIDSKDYWVDNDMVSKIKEGK